MDDDNESQTSLYNKFNIAIPATDKKRTTFQFDQFQNVQTEQFTTFLPPTPKPQTFYIYLHHYRNTHQNHFQF